LAAYGDSETRIPEFIVPHSSLASLSPFSCVSLSQRRVAGTCFFFFFWFFRKSHHTHSHTYVHTQIRFFLLQNRQGKTRLSKWYVPPSTTGGPGGVTTTNTEAEKVRIEAECHRLVTARDKKYTNFIEYNSYKLIYRRYAGLFFTIAVDETDNELSYLETIHLFVELLDSYFSNVCELDIVFNFNKVYSILDEFMLAGELEETSKREILERVKMLEKME
jgi:AP-2 complex subunit sigma-1